MKNTLIYRKTILVIAFLYSFCIMAQQNDIETADWAGDIIRCEINGNSIKCLSEDETVVYLERNDSVAITWDMDIDLSNVSFDRNSYLYIYPVIDNLQSIEENQSIKAVKAGNTTAISFENSYEIISYDNKFSINATLGDDRIWEIAIDNIFIDDEEIKSRYASSKGFALRFTGMKNAEVRNISISSEGSGQQDNDPDEPDNPDPEEPGNTEGTENLEYGDIVITEIMANPKGCPGYPEIEYIEILNRTDSVIELGGWTLRYGNSAYTIPPYSLGSREYVIMSHTKYSELWEEAGIERRIDMERFPVLANSGKKIYIHDAGNSLVAYTHYTEDRYSNKAKAEGGFSLERKDTENINDTRFNWIASESLLGGTPSMENSVNEVCNTTEPGTYLYYGMTAPDTINISFSSPLDAGTASDLTNYILEGEDIGISKAVCDSISLSSVTLVTDREINENDRLVLHIGNLSTADLSPLLKPDTISIAIPENPSAEEIVFNEILFDNDDTTCEFIELYNNTGRHIELKGLVIATKDNEGNYIRTASLSETSRIMEPETYIAFTSDTITMQRKWNVSMWKIAECNLPALNNDGGTVALLNRSMEEIDLAMYTPDIYPRTGKGSKGIAAEKTNPTYSSASPSNWLPATREKNYGTPGEQNSQYSAKATDTGKGRFGLQEDFITPDNDGRNDYTTINYSFNEGGYIANIRVFSSKGRTITCIAEKETLAQEGAIIWNGKDSEGNYLQPGIYIILIEAHSEKGDIVREKIAIAVN